MQFPEQDPNPGPAQQPHQAPYVEPQREEDVFLSANRSKSSPEEEKGTEVTENDGSVAETLDTAFHGKPGWSEGTEPSGSDRADYYEARSSGKSDVEEELEVRRNRDAGTDGPQS
ncbi:MAG TPA: hypothetical protein VHK69_09285 [Chitinophagaceae bacterium]|jgi:hypothetical protein|nr:hypothetical protein [Chitinophagaceae bacterium]